MMDWRRYGDGAIGAALVVIGAFFAVCLIVGLADILTWIGRH